MSEQKIFLNDIYDNEICNGSVFRAVCMMAKEARFINEQSSLGFIELEQKPTTIAIQKFKDNKLNFQEQKLAAAANATESSPESELSDSAADSDLEK
jgi:DNA-directed RNA polymerase subunit K/omega